MQASYIAKRFQPIYRLTKISISRRDLLTLDKNGWFYVNYSQSQNLTMSRFDISEPDLTIRDQNCWFCVNLFESQNLYVYWLDLTLLNQIWQFGTRIVDSVSTFLKVKTFMAIDQIWHF